MFRFIPAVVWAGIILLATCVSDFNGFIHNQMIQFQWLDQAHFAQLFLLPKSISYSYIIQKSGHIMAFFILAVISPFRPLITLLSGTAFALATEVLQVFFGRSGRLLDVGYDSVGLILGLLMFIAPFQNRKLAGSITLKK